MHFEQLPMMMSGDEAGQLRGATGGQGPGARHGLSHQFETQGLRRWAMGDQIISGQQKKGKDPTCKQGTRQKLVGTACRAVCISSQRDRSRQMMMLPNYVFCMCDTVEKAEKAPRSGPGQAPCMTNAGRLAGRRSLARAPSLLRRLCQGCLGVCQCVCVCAVCRANDRRGSAIFGPHPHHCPSSKTSSDPKIQTHPISNSSVASSCHDNYPKPICKRGQTKHGIT